MERAIRLAETVLQRNPHHADIDLFDLAVAHFFARHHDDAVALFDRLPEVFYYREIVAAAYAHAGRIDQARRHALKYVEELRATWVGKSATEVSDLLRWEIKYNCLYKRPEDVAHLLDGLHKAGLPIAVQDIET